ncbi:DHBP synthase RibB-like alpha/beta domain [Zea mays]|uniref:Threonylcarbamoyl-AMP synthase n=1 Tax=Zea mays TaxID=4577 RepID=A0A1D6PYB3_MAIZE|nr:DHBP synthase RibB-like alpha/beta domain [Zea mays]
MAAVASSFSRFSFRCAVCPSPLRVRFSQPHPPARLRVSSTVVALHKRNPKRLKYAAERQFTRGDAGLLRVEVEPSGGDFWKLDPIIDLINRGAVGVIPTDTVLELLQVTTTYNANAAPLSILCRSLRDIDTYTTGFPQGTNQGQANIFRVVKRAIPGPYTFILPASKQFPKQCIKHGSSTRYAKRRQVGVRIPDDPICQAILQNLDEPLICTSVKYLSEDEWILDPVIIADLYEPLDVQKAIKEKKECYRSLFHDRSAVNIERYKVTKKTAKRAVSEAKGRAYDDLYRRLSTKEREKDVYKIARIWERKTRDLNQVKCIKDEMDQLLVKGQGIKQRWQRYFDNLFNGENETMDIQLDDSFDDLNRCFVRRIQESEVKEALKRMKGGKAMGPDDIPIEMSKCLEDIAIV